MSATPAPAPLRSVLYEATVLHERSGPRSHRFVYRLFYFAIDLDELPRLHRRLALFSANRANVFSLRESDFLPTGERPHNPTESPAPAGPASSSLKSRVLALCAAHGANPGPQARVVLVTLPRVFGHQFNPVSFYFISDSAGAPVGAIAEVTNTFHEVKPYFVPQVEPGRFRFRTPKHFYVSPFSAPDADFDFSLRVPGDHLAIRIDGYADGDRTLHTTLTGRRRALTGGALAWFLAKYPLITLKIVASIHWEAFRLWAKRVPYFRKSAGASAQRDLYRPHSSIARDLPA